MKRRAPRGPKCAAREAPARAASSTGPTAGCGGLPRTPPHQPSSQAPNHEETFIRRDSESRDPLLESDVKERFRRMLALSDDEVVVLAYLCHQSGRDRGLIVL